MIQLIVIALVAGFGVGCGSSGGGAPAADASPSDTIDAGGPDAGTFVPGGAFTPATIRFRPGSTTAFPPCELDGAPVEYGARVLVDECVECQCTSFGLRCRRRDTCPDDRCVFIDGQVVLRGGTAIVETCFDCTCDSTGPACRRRTDAPCPVDGCMLGATEIELGAERFVSECHACTCDVNAGLLCKDRCHPQCSCDDANDAKPACAAVCEGVTCPIAIPNQDRVELACGSPVCDYGALVGAPGCE